jgi:trans-2-enoyl-CoA reductase
MLLKKDRAKREERLHEIQEKKRSRYNYITNKRLKKKTITREQAEEFMKSKGFVFTETYVP